MQAASREAALYIVEEFGRVWCLSPAPMELRPVLLRLPPFMTCNGAGLLRADGECWKRLCRGAGMKSGMARSTPGTTGKPKSGLC